ncbi:hypothetical protein [Corynebacterium glyciniphilum]|uniref:hypothetical protein n=1 Tax=Corynebacterium glyciniphilum TaxID=1404244 RepID=UPI003FD629DF
MVTQHTSIAAAGGRLAMARRYHPDQDHLVLEQELAAAKMRYAVAKIMAESPALTTEQVASVVAVLQHQDHTAVGDAA